MAMAASISISASTVRTEFPGQPSLSKARSLATAAERLVTVGLSQGFDALESATGCFAAA